MFFFIFNFQRGRLKMFFFLFSEREAKFSEKETEREADFFNFREGGLKCFFF